MPEEMPYLMRKAGVPSQRIPSARTIRRAEKNIRPQLRYRAGLAQYFDIPMNNIWDSRARETAAA